MSETQIPQDRPKVRVKVEPQPGSRLETLMTEHEAILAQSTELNEKEKSLREAIATELQAPYDPETLPDAIEIPAHPLRMYRAWTYKFVPGGWVLDSKRMQEENPELYVEYAKRRKGYWAFQPKQQGRGR